MQASELQDLIVSTLVRQHGGSARHWRLAVGPIRIYDRNTHPDVNWSVDPRGNARENTIVERLLDEVRLTYSVVEADETPFAETF